MLLVCAEFQSAQELNVSSGLFATFILLTYAFLYLLPSILVTKLAQWLVLWRARRHGGLLRGQILAIYGLAVSSATLSLFVMYADRTVYRMFGFHLNGFVWNLITTPGGIESMGGGASTTLTAALLASGAVAASGLLLWGVHCLVSHKQGNREKRSRLLRYRYAIILLLIVSLGERFWYGLSKLRDDTRMMIAADAFPFYLPTSFSSAARRFGYRATPHNRVHFDTDYSSLRYPREPISLGSLAEPLNIVWLVAESWRADMLDPGIMPATSAFASKAILATDHYSGGNGTRMGIFSMFYGLYGPYWFSFLKEARGPVIMDVLQQRHYDMRMYTSSSFSYPEFNKTIFAEVPAERLHSLQAGDYWERDRQNVSQLLESLDQRPKDRPFMRFMFFESPHARYYFPPECAIRKPYFEDLNYITMDPEEDMPLVYNRYVNACNHLDTQFERVIDYLRENALLDSTIVIMTGDHGEEFMEKGHWGHNSEFTEEQTRVPLILAIPGQPPRTIARMTSHLDIVATLMPLLGVNQPPSDFSLGHDLLGTEKRTFAVIADWSSICYVEPDAKMVIPLNLRQAFNNQVTTGSDQPMIDPSAFISSRQNQLVRVMKELRYFCE